MCRWCQMMKCKEVASHCIQTLEWHETCWTHMHTHTHIHTKTHWQNVFFFTFDLFLYPSIVSCAYSLFWSCTLLPLSSSPYLYYSTIFPISLATPSLCLPPSLPPPLFPSLSVSLPPLLPPLSLPSSCSLPSSLSLSLSLELRESLSWPVSSDRHIITFRERWWGGRRGGGGAGEGWCSRKYGRESLLLNQHWVKVCEYLCAVIVNIHQQTHF